MAELACGTMNGLQHFVSVTTSDALPNLSMETLRARLEATIMGYESMILAAVEYPSAVGFW